MAPNLAPLKPNPSLNPWLKQAFEIPYQRDKWYVNALVAGLARAERLLINAL